MTFGPGEHLLHDLESVGTTSLAFITVELMGGPNAPLEIG
jgi:hypothetical protein